MPQNTREFALDNLKKAHDGYAKRRKNKEIAAEQLKNSASETGFHSLLDNVKVLALLDLSAFEKLQRLINSTKDNVAIQALRLFYELRWELPAKLNVETSKVNLLDTVNKAMKLQIMKARTLDEQLLLLNQAQIQNSMSITGGDVEIEEAVIVDRESRSSGSE